MVFYRDVHGAWNKIEVDLSQYAVPISAFQGACAWLKLHADGNWTHSSTSINNRNHFLITYWIKDPQLAILFKLTWA